MDEPSAPVEAPAATRMGREREAVTVHRTILRGASVPPPGDAPRATFLHGFLLPFSLIVATIRDRELRRPYLRTALLRGLVVGAVGVFAISAGHLGDSPRQRRRANDTASVDAPGVHIDIDSKRGKREIVVLGREVPTIAPEDDDEAPPVVPPAAPTLAARWALRLAHGWAFVVALVGLLSLMEAVVVVFSRRFDDWLSFHASRLAGVLPEDEAPKTPGLSLDLAWLFRKLRRRIRGYVVLVAGFPALMPLHLVPGVGTWLFSAAVLCWTCYWLGVFAAGKSAHAWVDPEASHLPLPIRALQGRTEKRRFLGPIRWYGRVWAWVTRPVSAAVTTFERSPLPFLGLALARAILAFPGLYLLARPIIPVAAGRLCAEADPTGRFSIETQATPGPLPTQTGAP